MDTALDPSLIKRRKRLPLLVGAGLLLAVAAAAWGINRVVAPSVGTSDVMVAEVKRGNIANTVAASGVVIPVHEEQVPAPLPTRIAKVHAKPGQEVKLGDLLLELDDRTTRLAIEGLKEQLAQQEIRIATLGQEMEQKRKALVSSIELLDLDLQSAQAKLGRYNKLRAAGGVSGEDLLTAELNVKRAEIQLRQAREQIEDSKRATATSIDGARLQKSILNKQLDEQNKVLAQLQVRAPFAGVLTWLNEEEGAAVAGGQLVAKVSELNNFRVEATISDFHARSLQPGLPVRVEQGGQSLNGKVHTILPEIQNGTVKLIVTLDEPHHAMLRNKLRVEALIVTAQKNNTLIVDSGPAFNGQGRQDGFVVQGGAAHRTPLDIGSSDGRSVEILNGAKVGDRIIISSIARFKDVDTIRIR